MNIQVICIGKLKETYWQDAIKEYSKRLSRFTKLDIVELKEYKLRDNPSLKDELEVKIQEAEAILKVIKDNTYVITLEIKGRALTSEELADKMEDLALSGKSDIAFVIGGSLGLGEKVLNRSDFRLSFSKMTFPHQMMRVILFEQIYRSFKINRNETYHK